MVDAVRGEAAALGLERLWLLTTTAADFFERMGFQRTDRDSAPPAVRSSAQFAGLCPAGATCLRCDLAAPERDERDECEP